MKQRFQMFVLLLSLAFAQATYKISSASNSRCDNPGKGVFELKVDSEITEPLQFHFNLKSERGEIIQAQCFFGNSKTELPKEMSEITDEQTVFSEEESKEANGKEEEVEQEIQDTKEKSPESEKEKEKEAPEAEKEGSDEGKETPEAEKEGSDEGKETPEAEKEGSDEGKQTPEAEKEGSDEDKEITAEREKEEDDERKETTEDEKEGSDKGKEAAEEGKDITDAEKEIKEEETPDDDIEKNEEKQKTERENKLIEDEKAAEEEGKGKDEEENQGGEIAEDQIEKENQEGEKTKEDTGKEEEKENTEEEGDRKETEKTQEQKPLDKNSEEESKNDEKEEENPDEDEKESSEKNDFVEEGDDVDGEGKNPIGEEFNHEEEFSADQGNDQGRILEEDTNIIYCTFDTPIIKGKYEVDVESVSSSEVDLSEASLSFDIEPCISEGYAFERAKIFLSFRQVNFFSLQASYLFKFYALTSHALALDYKIWFLIYLIKGGSYIPQLANITCSIDKSVSIGPAIFNCERPKGDYDFDSIEIATSDLVSGFPADKDLMNPTLTAEAIAAGNVIDVSTTENYPVIIEGTPSLDISTIEEKAFFTLTIPITSSISGVEIGQTFDIYLNYPSGIMLIFEVIKIEANAIIIKCKIIGKVISQKLIIEQTIISYKGTELFVLPAFQTETEITTYGYNQTDDETEEEMNSDESSETNDETKESEGGENKEEKPDDKEGKEEEPEEKSEGQEEKPGDKEGKEEEPEEKPEGQEEKPGDTEGKEEEPEDKEGQEEKPDDKEGKEEEPEEKPEDKEEKPDDKEGKEEEPEEKPEDKEEKPDDKEGKEEEPEDKEGQEEKPDDKEGKEEEPEDKEGQEEKPDDKEEKPDDKEGKEEEPEEKPEGQEEKPDDKEGKEEEPEDKEGQEEKPGDKEDKEEEPEDKEEPEEKPEDKEGKEEEPKTQENKEESSSDKEQEKTSEKEEPTDEEKTEDITNATNATSDVPITKDEAEKIAEIYISFRQLSGFSFVGGVINFKFFALTTQTITIGETIELWVNLIGINGMEEEARNVECKSQEDVTPTEGTSIQVGYNCELSGLNESEGYTSLRLNSSDDVAGIPTDDDVLLNPVLTEESIKNNEIKDCSKDTSVPPTFVLDYVNQSNCKNDGKFFIQGKLSENKTIATKFTIPLTYPEGVSITCSYDGENMECMADRELKDGFVIEQAIITDGPEELFIIKNVTSNDEFKCGNGLLKIAAETINVDISFRQVSHIQKESNRFSFFFAAFVNSNLQASYSINMNIILMILDQKVEKVATCTLLEAVTTSGEATQGDFNCVVDLAEGEEDIPTENLTVSTNNDLIGGCSELTKEEASPKATDNAISNSGNAASELAEVIDYSLAINKNRKPPTFSITSFDLKRCETKGKLKIKGVFTENIDSEMTFELPFTYPSSNVKCTVDKATKGETTDITCKMQKVKKFSVFKSFVLQPKLLKKKRKEMLFIEKINMDLLKEYKCESFNELSLKRAKARKDSPFSFLQIGRPSGFNKLFFMALMKKKSTATFAKITIKVSLIIIKSRLRALEETEETDDLSVDCTVGEQLDNSASFECDDGSKKVPTKVDIDDDNISGVPDDEVVQTNPTPNYSEKESLQAIDSLPSVKIYNLTSDNCSMTGAYKIFANVTDGKELNFTTKKDITIPFSNPVASGLCVINVQSDKINMEMACEAIESFSPTEMIVEPQIVYDSDDTTPLFKIQDVYTVPTQFACVISDKSLKETTATPNKTHSVYRKKSSNGLSGGAIAGIVISIVAVVAIVGTIIALSKKGFFNNANNHHELQNSSIDRFGHNIQISKVP